MRCKCGNFVNEGKTWEIDRKLCWDCDQLLIAQRDGKEIRYQNYTIERDIKPIADRRYDWGYIHDDYDGPEDGRSGTAASILDCKIEIDIELESNV